MNLRAGPVHANRSAVAAAGIFIGITLGISSDADTVRALMIALFFHQGKTLTPASILDLSA